VIHPIVTWTTPYQRADVAWREAAEHLEFHRYGKARINLQLHIRNLRLLLDAISHEEATLRRIEQAQSQAALDQFNLALRESGDAVVDWG
jgi:hypothetical protein